MERGLYEKDGVFSKNLIDGVIDNLLSFKDADIRKEIEDNPEKMSELVKKYYHYG